MANRNIDERFRKPRRAKGTPFFATRNYYSLAVLAIGAGFWLLFERSSGSSTLRKYMHEGVFDYSPLEKQRFAALQIGLQHPNMQPMINKLQERTENETKQE